MNKFFVLALASVFFVLSCGAARGDVVAENAAPQLVDAVNDVEIVKLRGILYVRTESGCWWIRVGALDEYPVEWTSAGEYLAKHVNSDPETNRRICRQSSIWVVADTARETRPVYLKRKNIGRVNVGDRCFDFVRRSSFGRQYRTVDYPGGGYALCEIQFVTLLSGAIN